MRALARVLNRSLRPASPRAARAPLATPLRAKRLDCKATGHVTIYTATFATTSPSAISVVFYVGSQPRRQADVRKSTIQAGDAVLVGPTDNGAHASLFGWYRITLQDRRAVSDCRRVLRWTAPRPRHGEALVHVFHRDGVQLRFEAGPFLVVVSEPRSLGWTTRQGSLFCTLRRAFCLRPVQVRPVASREGQPYRRAPPPPVLNAGGSCCESKRKPTFRRLGRRICPRPRSPAPHAHAPPQLKEKRKNLLSEGEQRTSDWGRSFLREGRADSDGRAGVRPPFGFWTNARRRPRSAR